MRKIWMLVTMVLLTTSAGWSAGTNASCQGTCVDSGQPVSYRCGYNVSASQCCSQTRTNACPGDLFSGTCRGTNGTIGC